MSLTSTSLSSIFQSTFPPTPTSINPDFPFSPLSGSLKSFREQICKTLLIIPRGYTSIDTYVRDFRRDHGFDPRERAQYFGYESLYQFFISDEMKNRIKLDIMENGEVHYFGIPTANNMLSDTPSDINVNTKTRMAKFQLPDGIFDSQSSSIHHSSTGSQCNSNKTTNNNINFLDGIEAKRSQRNNGHNQPYTENNKGEYINRHSTSRKYFAPLKPVEQMVNEQREMTSTAITQRRLPIQIYGGNSDGQQHIISSFDEIRLTDQIRSKLLALNYFNPTDVQKCVIPLIQNTNNDILCLAATGSGKTGAFFIPLILRIQGLRLGPQGEQKQKNVDSPYTIVVAHTRELVGQLHNMARIFADATGVGVALAKGGMPEYECRKQLEEGCDILVITPGKLNDYLSKGRIKVNNVQFVVIDEADKFISEDDFANGLRELKENIRRTKNIQCRTFMFSATLNEIAQCLIDQFLEKDFYHIIVGKVNQAVSHVRQHIFKVERLKFGKNPKMLMLRETLMKISNKIVPKNGEHFQFDTKPTIIFANESRKCDRIAISLSRMGFRAMSINGHRSPKQRYKAVEDFKCGRWHILVGTDVIARGMNFPKVDNVILFELPLTYRYEQYVHRIGRTGRISENGQAYVFFDPVDPNDHQLAEFLVQQLRESNQLVPTFLLEIEQARAEQQIKAAEYEAQEKVIRDVEYSGSWSNEQKNDEFCNAQWDN